MDILLSGSSCTMILEFEMIVLCQIHFREENRRTSRKILSARTRTNNKINPHAMPVRELNKGHCCLSPLFYMTLLTMLILEVRITLAINRPGNSVVLQRALCCTLVNHQRSGLCWSKNG